MMVLGWRENLLARLRTDLSDWLANRSIRRDHSRYGWRTAPPYTVYHRRCRAAFAQRGGHLGKFSQQSEFYAVNQFVSAITPESTRLLTALRERVATELTAGRDVFTPNPFEGEGWRRFPEIEYLFQGDLGSLIRAAFRSEFKILHGFFGRKEGGAATRKLWHSDSGPGTCINVFVYLSDGQPDFGPTIILPWPESQEIFVTERAWLRQHIAAHPALTNDKRGRMAALGEFYENEIARRFPDKVTAPSGATGLMVLFNNSTLHAADTPKPGRERIVAHFRVFPALDPIDFARLARHGLPGKRAVPPPDAEF
jgi:hypothetical protein